MQYKKQVTPNHTEILYSTIIEIPLRGCSAQDKTFFMEPERK